MMRFPRYAVLALVAAGALLAASPLIDPLLPAWSAPTPTPGADRPRLMIAAQAAATPTTSPTAAPARIPIFAVGDSIMLSAAADLRAALGDITIDAEVGRQVPAAIDVLSRRRAAGGFGQVVIVHIGTNGAFSVQQFDAMMEMLAGVRRVIFVNVRAPLAWEKPDNEMLAGAVKRYPNTVLVDWYGATANRPGLFWDDGVHLRPEGVRVYVALLAAAVTAP